MALDPNETASGDLPTALHRMGNAVTAVECLWYVLQADQQVGRHDDTAWNKMDDLIADLKVALEKLQTASSR